MNDSSGILIAIALGVVLIASLVFFLIPEPSEQAIIATERLDVAVLAFRNSSTWTGVEETLRGRVESRLVNTPGIDVFSRTQLDALLIEAALSAGGMIDPATAMEIGALTGVSKLITAAVYAVDTRSDETTVCISWEDGACTETVPATKYTARILAQVEVVDTQTGRIETAIDASGSEDATVREGSTFGGFDSLLATSATEIAGQIVSELTTAYTREIRYGLYASVEPKREGYVGRSSTYRFSADADAVHLIAHFTRVRDLEPFDLVWLDPEGNEVDHVDDVVSAGAWRHYTLDLNGLTAGRYRVQGFLNGIPAFDDPFVVSR